MAIRVTVLLLAALGIVTSLNAVLALFGAEPDSAHALVLWYGVQEHGIGWVEDWLFTQDNWILSLFPFNFLGFYLFGDEISVVIFTGWIIYIASAVVAAAIAWNVGARNAAIFVFALLVSLNLYSHTAGFASYPVSHNITNLFGLIAILCMVCWINRPRIWLLVLLFVFLTCGAVSDPWMVASYNLPLFLSVFALLYLRPGGISRSQIYALAAVVAMSIVATETKLFGLLYFLRGTHFSVGNLDVIGNNIVYLIKDFGGLMNFVPFSGPNPFYTGLVSAVVLLAILYGALHTVYRHRHEVRFSNSAIVFLVGTTLSIGGIMAAFILADIQARDYSGRFLINCLYLLIIGIAVLSDGIWNLSRPSYRATLGIAATAYVVTSLVSLSPYILDRRFEIKDSGALETIAFLKQEGLSYGYGPYWGANANTVTALSHSEVRIRPVMFDRETGMMIAGGRPQTNNRWYTDEDIPPQTDKFFVMVVSDGEECPDIELCFSGLRSQFGEPVRTLTWRNATVLVWDRKLVG